MTENSNNRLKLYLPIIISLSVIVGVLIGAKLSFNDSRDSFIDYPSPDKLSTVLDYISKEYVDSVSKDDLIEKTIPELLSNLDPHSIYIPASELKEMSEPLEGNFDGIGVQFNILHDTIVVVNIISGGPSEKRGVMPGDRIVKINDTLVAGIGISTNDVMRKLKGKRGTKVTISVKRKKLKNLLNITIVRDRIPLESVDVAYMISNDIGYVKISKFAKTTYHEFKDAVSALREKGMKKMIMDLRNNAGGYMDGATNIADEFLESGKLIVYTKGHARPKREIFSTSNNICLKDQLIILIDEWSASASEILAGAIQDNDRGLIIGRRSFGKGLVQEPTFFSDGSSIRLTVARYYTPTGRCIQKSYSNGYEDYYNELADRYLHGELEIKDSIHFADSLKYTTAGGRVVYGGGGIMPDIFVPVDTSGITDYYSKIVSQGLIYEFAFNYTDNHRDMLKSLKDYKALNSYLDNKELLKSFTDFASNKGISTNAKQLEESKTLIITLIKAYIGRNLFDNTGFYPFIKNVDETLLRAIKEFSDHNNLKIIK